MWRNIFVRAFRCFVLGRGDETLCRVEIRNLLGLALRGGHPFDVVFFPVIVEIIVPLNSVFFPSELFLFVFPCPIQN